MGFRVLGATGRMHLGATHKRKKKQVAPLAAGLTMMGRLMTILRFDKKRG